MSSAIDQVLDLIGNMSVLELSELKKKYEDKFGVTAAAPMMAMPMGGMMGGGAAAAGHAKAGGRLVEGARRHAKEQCSAFLHCRQRRTEGLRVHLTSSCPTEFAAHSPQCQGTTTESGRRKRAR